MTQRSPWTSLPGFGCWLGLTACLALVAGCDKGKEPEGPAGGKAAKAKAAAKLPVVPAGLPPVAIPEGNPMTEAKVELGKLLYFDKRLSTDGTVSCATCHDPTKGWAERTKTSTGIKSQVGGRNSPTVINAAYYKELFWDGRSPSLEDQALGPIENPIEMGHTMTVLVDDLKKVPEYQKRFQEVFATEVTPEGIGKAIAAFERTVLSGDSPYDDFAAGDESALTDAQKKGWEVFQDAGCSTCHAPATFSNSQYYNAGIGMDAETPDIGRMEVTKKESDTGKFRVPALREVENTAPYFHDGSAATLADAVEVMASGGKDNPNLSVLLKAVRDKNLTAEDKQNLVEFLKALSGEYPIIEPPKLP